MNRQKADLAEDRLESLSWWRGEDRVSVKGTYVRGVAGEGWEGLLSSQKVSSVQIIPVHSHLQTLQ